VRCVLARSGLAPAACTRAREREWKDREYPLLYVTCVECARTVARTGDTRSVHWTGGQMHWRPWQIPSVITCYEKTLLLTLLAHAKMC
jgi:hypothetical protein